jgi:hypothetical protein
MSNSKRHHYLPIAYQEGFVGTNGFVWVYDRVRNTFRSQTPMNTAVISHYYSVPDSSGKQRTELETGLMQFIDGTGISAINVARETETINTEDRAKIAVFCAFLKFRVPAFEKSFNHMSEQMVKLMSKKSFSSPEQTAAIVSSMKEDTGYDGVVDPKALTDFAQKGNYSVKTSRAMSLHSMLDAAQDIALHLHAMDWCFYRPASNKTFVTSDNPFVLLPPPNWKPGGFYGFGICTQGAQKVIPLAHDLCLFICDEGTGVSWRTADREQTRAINLNITSNCHEYAIGRDEALVKSLVKTTGIDSREWKPSMRVQ